MTTPLRKAIRVTTWLAAPYVAGSGSMVLAPAGGNMIGVGSTFLLTAINGNASSFSCAGVSGDTLTGVALVEGADEYYPAGSTLELTATGGGGGGGTGTVTSVSVVTTNGISGTVANPTTTPAISLALGAITPTSVTTTIVTGLGTPASPSDAANKAYVDAIAAGLVFIAPGARVATTAALTAAYANGASGVGATLTNSGTQAAIAIDGVTLSAADVVLVKNQAAPAQNGIYTVTSIGSGSTNWVLTRQANYDQTSEIVSGSYTAVGQGTANAATLWIMTGATPITVGTTAIPFSQLNITGSGSVTSFSVITNNGITGSVANPTTTPALTLGLGAITPSSVAATGTVTGSNLSGTNTGDQTITLTSDVTGTGTGSFATTIKSSVALAGNPTTTTQAPGDSSTRIATTAFVSAAVGASGGGTITQINTGNGLTGGPITTTGTISLAPIAAFTLLGNPTSAGASVSAVTLGAGLSFSGSTLVASGSGGTVTTMSIASSHGFAGTVTTATTTPVVTLSTTVTGLLKGDGTSILAATPGTDYLVANQTITLSGAVTGSGSTAIVTSFGNFASLNLLANTTGGTAAPAGVTLSALMDPALGSVQGDVIYRGVSAWSALAPGTAGQVLTTGGAAANPSWAAVPTTTGPHLFTAVLGLNTSIATGTNSTSNYLVCPFAGTFTRWDMVCPSANQPSGASLVVDVLKSAAGAGSFTTLWSTTANRPTLTTGTNNAGGTAFNTTTFNAGDVLRFDVITAGGGSVQNVTLVISSRMGQ